MRHRAIVNGSALRFNGVGLSDLPPLTRMLAGWIQSPAPLGLRRLHLQGGLGAGKTEFARSLLRALGVEGRIKSPSFSIAESYSLETGCVLQAHHLDLFRLHEPEAWRSAGLRELLSGGDLVLVEWPERARGLPAPDLLCQLDWPGGPDSESREMVFTPGADWPSARQFLDQFASDWPEASVP